jgi:hypothetical protein
MQISGPFTAAIHFKRSARRKSGANAVLRGDRRPLGSRQRRGSSKEVAAGIVISTKGDEIVDE